MKVTSTIHLDDGNTITIIMDNGTGLTLDCSNCQASFVIDTSNYSEALRSANAYNAHVDECTPKALQ